MNKRVPSLDLLLRTLQKIPYLASKNIYRVASHFLKQDASRTAEFCDVLRRVKENVTQCADCFTWREATDGCPYCSSERRKKNVVCVVETWQDLLAIEKTDSYQGVYHVLGGVICPLDGVSPGDLTIDQLVARVAGGTISEVILALNQTPEGEATSAFIDKKLKLSSIAVTRLARGLPVGSSIESMDRVTVHKALSERRPF